MTGLRLVIQGDMADLLCGDYQVLSLWPTYARPDLMALHNEDVALGDIPRADLALALRQAADFVAGKVEESREEEPCQS